MSNSKYDLEDSEEWLMFFNEKKSQVQELRELVAQRDTSSKGGIDVSKLNADIRRKFQKEDRDIKSLKSSLKNLKDLSSKEITRRRTEIEQLMDEKEDLFKKFQSGPKQGKNDLFEEKDYSKIEEHETTKNMDAKDLLLMQNKIMSQQDEGLGHLSIALDRTKQMGTTISDELDEQKRLLDDVDHNVNKVSGNIQNQTRRIEDVMKASRIPILLCCIIILIIIFVVVLILMLKIIIGF